jgi:hypothetical protein
VRIHLQILDARHAVDGVREDFLDERRVEGCLEPKLGQPPEASVAAS